MKKLLIILLSLFILLTAVACIGRRAAPAESGTTEESLEGSWWITEEKIYPPIDRAVFDGIEVGKSLDEYSELLSGHKCEMHGYRTIKYYCTDGGVMYLTYTSIYRTETDKTDNRIVASVSSEFKEITYEKELGERLTVGMTVDEVVGIMGDIGIDATSGLFTGFYKFTDGSHATVYYGRENDEIWRVVDIKVSSEPTNIF